MFGVARTILFEGASQLALAMKGALNTNFVSEGNFADVLTRSSSLLQGESDVSVMTPAMYSLYTS